jgi:hypothetical protein
VYECTYRRVEASLLTIRDDSLRMSAASVARKVRRRPAESLDRVNCPFLG